MILKVKNRLHDWKESIQWEKKIENDYRLFWKRNSEPATMLDVWRHTRWVCASLIRSREESLIKVFS